VDDVLDAASIIRCLSGVGVVHRVPSEG